MKTSTTLTDVISHILTEICLKNDKVKKTVYVMTCLFWHETCACKLQPTHSLLNISVTLLNNYQKDVFLMSWREREREGY